MAHRTSMFFASSKTHSQRLADVVRKKFLAKINRGMKLRSVGDRQLLLEDTEEWLDNDTKILRLNFKQDAIHVDIYACTNYQTSISGLCVSLSVIPHSFLWDVLGFILSLAMCMTFMTWIYVFVERHDYWHPFLHHETQ